MKFLLVLAPLALALAAQAQAPAPHPEPLGYTDTPILVGQPWHVHDPARPHPRMVTPASVPGGPPSDAIVLFDGHDLSHWESRKSLTAPRTAPTWKVENGYIECVPGQGDLVTKEKFGDMQLHVEWRSPQPPVSNSQGRGNSGVFLMGRFEIQVLDSWNNPTYADGQASAIYGQWPPLVNPIKPSGEWNAYDIVFEAPRMDGDKVLKPANVTVFFNGVLTQYHVDIAGPTMHRQLAHYTAQPAEDSLSLQNHGNTVRYRNIWVRRLTPHDVPESK
jgi:hypothetical protein